MSSSSGGSESTASMREGTAEAAPNMDPNASMAEEEQKESAATQEVHEEPKEEEEATDSVPEVQAQIQQSPDNRMASVITINGVEAAQDVTFVEMNSGMSSGRSERSGFDNAGFVDDEAHGKGSGGGSKVVNGGGRLSPPSSPPPRPPSPAGPFLNSVVATTPPPSGANGRGPVMETPNSNVHNNSGLIMTPNDKEKSEIDGCTNVTEAVNLELVNMNPYGGAGLGVGDEVAGGKSGTNGGLNGIPVKRGAGDEETGDGGFGDPYDEYFVPVNEHRKYIRGEKLYVTKDRRRSQSWKRCICWGVGFTLLAIAILIAVLAGTGVILSQEEEGKAVESRGFSNHNIPLVAESRDPNAPAQKEPIPTEPPPEPSSSFTPPPSMSSVPVNPPTTEMSSLYVPRVLEGEMKIDSLNYTSDLENSSSSAYMKLSGSLKEELMRALFDEQMLMNGPADIFIQVVGFSPGSVVVKFHVGWRFKHSHPASHDPITMEALQDELKGYLHSHGKYLYTYRIEPETVKANHVMDMCQISNGGCSHECRYDYEEAKFMCNCPPGLFLDQTGKRCITELIDDSTTTTSTKGPFYDENPWMPMQPKEPTFVTEVAKHEESVHGSTEGPMHNNEEMHREEDNDKMHEDHPSHFTPLEPEHETKDDIHKDHYGDYDSFVKENDKESEMHHIEMPVKEHHEEHHVEHHEEHQLIPSVGTGRSSSDHVAVVEHSSEESNEAHDSTNDADYDEASHVNDEEQKGEEKVEESKDGMGHLGHSVDSSENTSEETHDSMDTPGSNEEMDHGMHTGNHDMSSEGEVTDGSNEYHPSHSLSNELHEPIPVTTTSENPNWNGLESHESEGHKSPEVEEHSHIISTSPPVVPETVNDTEHHGDDWPLKSEIISAVEHVIVKDENETTESTQEDDEEHMVHKSESDNDPINDTAHGMDELEAHVVMEGEEKDEDIAELEKEVMMEHHIDNMPMEDEDKVKETMEEHEKDEIPEENRDAEPRHKEDDMGSVMSMEDGKEEHKKDGEMESEDEMIKGEEEPKEDTSRDEMVPKSENEKIHIPVIAEMHEENDVGHNEKDIKKMESHDEKQISSEGGGEVTDHVMHEEANKASEEVMSHSTETTFGTESHEMELTFMNHKKPMMENEENKQNEHHMENSFISEEHGESEKEMSTEIYVAATGENEADIANEKPSEKEEETVWTGIKETREHEVKTEEHENTETSITEGEVLTKNHEENTMVPEENMKEMEDKMVMADHPEDHSMEKPSSDEESSTVAMENPEISSTHADNLANVLDDNEEERGMKVVQDEPKVDLDVSEDGIRKPDDYDNEKASDAIPKEEILHEDDDPNIVPVEETAKEAAVEDIDSDKSISPGIGMRIVGLGEDKDIITGKENNTEMPSTNEAQEHPSDISTMSISEGIAAMENHDEVSKMPMDDKVDVSMSSSTLSPAENSIENLSDQYNSTSGVPPSAENDQLEHLGSPVTVVNESATVMTTPSPKENNIDDPPLHLQAGIPMSEEQTAQSSSTTETAIANDLHAEKEENTDEKIAELDRIEKVIDDMETSFKKAAAEDEENLKTMSTEASMGEKSSEKEEKMMKEDIEDAAKVNLGEREEKVVDNEGKEKLEPENKEEVSSITTVNQDFTAEHANTVHAINPTSPSTTIEESPKVEGISGPTVTKINENIDLEGTATKDENHAPEPHLPFETDDNERSNNLATLDNEDALPLSEGGNEAIVKVGAVDLGLKSTTEHTNEILSAPIYGNNWPATALAVNNMNKTQQESEITSEEPMKEKEDVTKTTTFEIPIKKKGEFKKPIHHEDEISKPLFGKEGKETTNKVDKIGLAAISPNKDSSKEEMNSEEMDDFTTTEMPTATPHNMDTASSSSTEAAITASTSAIDKGGEKLNAISEDDSETKKDLGKALVKETVKDLSEAITVKPETTLKDESHEMEEKVTTVSVDELESTTQEMRESEKDNFASEVSASKEEKETEDIMTTESSKADESAEITTTMPDLADSSDEKNGKGVEFKDIPETTSVKDRPMEEGKETTTKMNVVEEMVNPTSTEAAQGKAEELLKEMGGYGEGGHKVVPKSGVELMDHEKETLPEKSTTEVPDSVDSTSSSLMASSSTSSPFLSSSAAVETFSPTTVPPESETANPEVNNELEEKTLNKVKSNDETEASKNENATSEDPIPTMMIHEIVPSISHSSTSLPLEPTSSTSSPEVSFSKESEESTTVGESPEIITLNSIPDNTMMTSSPDTAGVTTMTHILEILDKDETSSFLKKDSEKEVVTENVTETSTEAKIPDVITTEKITVAVSNITTSVLPEIDQQYFSKCPAGQFQCTNGTSLNPFSVSPISSYVPALSPGVACVPLSAKCDSINDCSDGSDELGCIEEGCPGNFQCSNGQCLKRHLVCNGIVDCNDGSDEVNCEKWQCQFDEFQCPSGRCIPVLWQCDGKPDCDNHTDEYSCQDSCGNNEYLCPERWCIPMSWRCNGVPECANGEDEKLCDCSLEQVKCGTGGCVAKTEVCDGVDQCPDQSDEWGCVRLHNETMKLEVRTTENDWLSVCADRWETDWSNFVCQSFGYSQAVFTEYPSAGDLDGHTEVFVLKPGASVSSPPGNSMRLPGVLQKVAASECTSGSIVEISCQEFTCGNHGLADGVAARLVGGDEAANGQWPSVALLYHTRQRSTCTASIVSPRWLVASYNCLHIREKSLSPDGWVAFGGGSTFDKDKPETQIRSVRSIVPYPQVKYNRFLYNHDVALVELVQPLTFTRSVGAICLPEKPIEPRQLCVTAGWGYTSPGEINFSQYLHYLPVPTIDLNECNSTKHYSGFITEDKICAGFTDAMHSPCYNDEGAPLMCVSEGGIWELQGVLSYHSNCGRGYHPSIFSSMTAIKDWMKRVVGSRFERRSTFNVRRRRRTKRRREVNNEMINIIWT